MWALFRTFFAFVLLCTTASAQQNRTPARPTGRETRYYTIYSDLDETTFQEANLRITRLFDEYVSRTKGFSGQMRTRLGFYLYRSEQQYLADGGRKGTAGLFTGDKLMAVLGERPTSATWHTVQHEAFHQFAHFVIGSELPIWANEGMAEYFGEAIFTGDGYIVGVIPPYRLKRIRTLIESGRYRKLDSMLDLTHADWADQMSLANYDQAWSMVHFLAHGENGKYQQAFAEFIRRSSRGEDARSAWQRTLGGSSGFEAAWLNYWQKLPDQPTRDLYIRAAGQSLGAFLNRALQARQTFGSFDDFASAGRKGQIKSPPRDRLPDSLFDEMIELADRVGSWTLVVGRNGSCELKLETDDHLLATVQVTSAVGGVTVSIDDLPRAIHHAQQLRAKGDAKSAIVELEQSLMRNGKSPSSQEAAKLLRELKNK